MTQGQLLRADRHAFLRMSEVFQGNLKDPVAGDKNPLDNLFNGLHTDVSVTYFMLPVPAASSKAADKTAGSEGA